MLWNECYKDLMAFLSPNIILCVLCHYHLVCFVNVGMDYSNQKETKDLPSSMETT